MRYGRRTCPNCDNDLWWEEADVGVGIIYGPAHCDDPDCGYSEDSWELCEPDGRVPRDQIPKPDEWHAMIDKVPLDDTGGW